MLTRTGQITTYQPTTSSLTSNEWDAKYGITMDDVKPDAVFVTFQTLPDDLAPLAADIYKFCPDTIDQHFGCVAELLEMAEELGEDVPPEIHELAEGVDMNADNYGRNCSSDRSANNKTVALWWD